MRFLSQTRMIRNRITQVEIIAITFVLFSMMSEGMTFEIFPGVYTPGVGFFRRNAVRIAENI